MRTSGQILAEIKAATANVEHLKWEAQQAYLAEMATRAEAGKNDPSSGFYTGYARDAWGYPLDPLDID